MVHTLTVHPVPEKGQFEINVPAVVDVRISAEEAQKRCRIWLMDEINMGFVSGEPEFVFDENGRAMWRIPIIYTAAHVGHVGQVGSVDMDVNTREIFVEDDEIESWYEKGDELADTLPPFKLLEVSAEFLPPPHLQAPIGTRIE